MFRRTAHRGFRNDGNRRSANDVILSAPDRQDPPPLFFLTVILWQVRIGRKQQSTVEAVECVFRIGRSMIVKFSVNEVGVHPAHPLGGFRSFGFHLDDPPVTSGWGD